MDVSSFSDTNAKRRVSFVFFNDSVIFAVVKTKLTDMKTIRTCFCLLFSLILLSGCASIVSKSSWPFTVDSNPPGALVTISNKAGKEIFIGRTPAAMKLKSGSGFFGKESYTIAFSLNGFETKKVTVDCRLNGWYFGNIIFGGLLGMLIIDPATGAMYKLDGDGITENLQRAGTTSSSVPALNILDKNGLTETQEKHLVRLN